MRAVFAVAILALAGCAGPSTPMDPGDAAFDDLETTATSTTGVIRGVVVDAAINPIAGAKVVIKAIPMETTTTEDGAFAFSGVDPGNHFLHVSKVGFDTVQYSTTVEAGIDKPAILRIQLQASPGSLPYFRELTWDGFIECSVRVGTANMAGSVGVNACNGVGGQDVNFRHGDVEADPQWMQAELVWKSTQAAGDELSLVVGPPDCRDVKYTRADGPSPQVYTMDAAKLQGPGGSWGPVGPEQSVCTRVFTYTSGTFQHLWGMQLQQRFSVYVHTFYAFTPDEAWQFSMDGPPIVPE